MPANVEIKARVSDVENLLCKAQASASSHEVLKQTDTYFNVPHGRLKLRETTAVGREKSTKSELIHYDRPDISGPKLSRYQKQTFHSQSEAIGLKNVLSKSLGSRGVVTKVRHLLMVGQTRVHIDSVQGLGHFLELEVMLREDQTPKDGEGVAAELLCMLGAQDCSLEEGSYIDLLLQNT